MLYMIWTDFIRCLKRSISYKRIFIMDLLVLIVTLYFAMSFEMGTGIRLFIAEDISDSEMMILRFMGFVYWIFITSSLTSVSSGVIADSTVNLLEVRLRGLYSYRYVSIGQYLSSIFTTAIISGIITLIAMFTLESFNINFILYLITMTLTIVLTLIGMYGISLMIGGFAMVNKKVGNIFLIVNGCIFFIFNTSLMYQNVFLEYLPMTKALAVSRNVYMDISVSIFDWIYLIITNVLILIIGGYVFDHFTKKARNSGAIPTR